ncbi:DUF541 domain-containing protein [Alcaligenaceae bacterium SJ-26]|nr:DUF541 domain-containing protein [Alcaligenaceae bacterium SJ-26]
MATTRIATSRFGRHAVLGALLLTGSMGAAIGAPGERPLERHERATRLTLQAGASTEVQQDTVNITLASEVEAASEGAVSEPLAQRMAKVMEAAKRVPNVKAHTGSYRIWPNTDRDGKITAWRGRAEVNLESTDFGAASRLAAEVSAEMPIAGIYFSLSEQARAAQEKQLLRQAATAFRERAQEAAEAFGFAGYQIRKLDLSGSGMAYEQSRVRMGAAPAMMSLKADSAPVPLEADTVSVSVSVNGEVELQGAGSTGK